MNNIADDLSNAYSDGLRDGAPKWIKTADRLPEPGEMVLATSGKFAGEAYMDEAGFWFRHYGFSWMTAFGRPVTHWCKMPEPPGGEGEG